jgi:signal peptidase I
MEASLVELGTEVRAAETAARLLGRVAQWAATLLAIAAFVGLAVLPHLGMYRTLTVLTASMKPTFSPGDVVVVRPEPIQELKVGQVISYQVPVGVHQVETHRVVKILRGAGTTTPVIQTKGDNNTVVDPWTAQLNGTTVYRLVAVVPEAGYAINFLRGPLVHLLTVFFFPALLAGYALRRIWNAA